MTDPEIFEVFVRNYQDMVFSTALRLLGNPADAEDISQTVFLKAYGRFAELSHSPAIGGWLKAVATNLSLNHLSRYRARWRFFSEMRSEESDGEFVDDQPAPDALEQSLVQADDRRWLESAIQRLPAAQRVPLVLYHFQDRSYEEIALALRVSLTKVKTDIHRGRQALRKIILRSDLTEPGRGRFRPGEPDNDAPPEKSARSLLLKAALHGFTRGVTDGLTPHPSSLRSYGT
jgi:RNA polymerase sigma-70 factor (ECF subfamily)